MIWCLRARNYSICSCSFRHNKSSLQTIFWQRDDSFKRVFEMVKWRSVNLEMFKEEHLRNENFVVNIEANTIRKLNRSNVLHWHQNENYTHTIVSQTFNFIIEIKVQRGNVYTNQQSLLCGMNLLMKHFTEHLFVLDKKILRTFSRKKIVIDLIYKH